MIEIRRANAQDMTAVYDLICALEETHFAVEAFRTGYAKLLADPAHVLLVATAGEMVVGLLHLRMEFQLHHCALVAEILELIVSKDCRSQGMGTALISAAEKIARSSGCVQIEVTSHQSRTKAHGFYRRQNMAQTHIKLVKQL